MRRRLVWGWPWLVMNRNVFFCGPAPLSPAGGAPPVDGCIPQMRADATMPEHRQAECAMNGGAGQEDVEDAGGDGEAPLVIVASEQPEERAAAWLYRQLRRSSSSQGSKMIWRDGCSEWKCPSPQL
jgi:hypothetical protein